VKRNELLRRSWAVHDQARSKNLPIVTSSIPIAWFGDLIAYKASKVRVVTVGLNPSFHEFPISSPFVRFPAASAVRNAPLTDEGLDSLATALNTYFQCKPYRAWFDRGYEPLLNGLGASYYGTHEAVALHTDLCSPLATSIVWSKLSNSERSQLCSAGIHFWCDLIRFLMPDLVIMSVATANLSLIPNLPPVNTWDTAFAVERKNPFLVRAIKHAFQHDAYRTLMVFGQAAQLPFGTVSTNDKMQIGSALRKRWESSLP
jgi:hypothetical protein